MGSYDDGDSYDDYDEDELTPSDGEMADDLDANAERGDDADGSGERDDAPAAEVRDFDDSQDGDLNDDAREDAEPVSDFERDGERDDQAEAGDVAARDVVAEIEAALDANASREGEDLRPVGAGERSDSRG